MIRHFPLESQLSVLGIHGGFERMIGKYVVLGFAYHESKVLDTDLGLNKIEQTLFTISIILDLNTEEVVRWWYDDNYIPNEKLHTKICAVLGSKEMIQA